MVKRKTQKPLHKFDEQTIFRHSLKLLRDARKRGKRKNVTMSLTAEDVVSLYHKQRGRCALSGTTLLCGSSSLRQYNAMSLDRCIPRLGYAVGNVQLLTRAVNNAKSTMLKDEFVTMCLHVSSLNKKKLA